MKVDKITACHHDLEKMLKGSGGYNVEWLKKERMRWHPDKFPGQGEVQA